MVRTPSLNLLSQALYNARQEWAENNNINFTDDYEEYQIRPQEQNIINIIEEKLELKYLDHGASRIVFSLPNNKQVVKISRYGNSNRIHDGKEQSNREIAIWEKILYHNDQNEIPVLPINQYNTGRYWITQPKVKILENTGYNKDEKEKIRKKVQNKVLPLSSKISLWDLINNKNIGILNNKAYLIDYGLEPDYDLN